MVKKRIIEGDTVDVLVAPGVRYQTMLVLHIPGATGDCWNLQTKYGILVYVQQFLTMTLMEPDKNGVYYER